MAAVRLSLDARSFSADVVARTAHRYTDRFFVELTSSDDVHVVTLTPKHDDIDSTGLEGRFRNDALDERLREHIKAETADLHLSLVQAALRQAMPTRSES
jgi:His-Xaa-Ser system protein HxsD